MAVNVNKNYQSIVVGATCYKASTNNKSITVQRTNKNQTVKKANPSITIEG